MQNYHRILVASDLSPASHLLIEKALHIAQQDIQKINLMHVINYPPTLYGSSEFAIPLDPELEQSLFKQAKHNLEEQGAAFGLSAERLHIIEGTASHCIIGLAKDLQADLIVVGGHDKHGLALLFGSTANTILHAMPCDILTVRIDE